jgi:hypothetical protein
MVLWTAQALLDNNYDSPQQIIPTIVFGAVSVDDARLGELREALSTIEWGSERGRRLRSRFGELFKWTDVWALVDGVPIIRQDPIRVVYSRTTEDDQRITIDIIDISARPEEVSSSYKESLAAFSLDEGFAEEGGVSWQVGPGVIHMMVHPGLPAPDIDAIVRLVRNNPQPERRFFPPAGLIGEVYATLRGSNAKGRFRGFGRSVLPGSLTNKPEAKTLVPACVAWYLAGRKTPVDYETKAKITELLNRHLLAPCGLEELSKGGGDFNQLWGNVRKRADVLNRTEQALFGRLRHSEFMPGYFSASENQ